MTQASESLERQSVVAVEPVLSVGWLADEAREAMTGLGLTDFFQAYTATRIAPMGAVPASVVASVFFNFCPDIFVDIVPSAWSITTPERILEAEQTAVDKALGPVLRDVLDQADGLAGLMRQAAEDASAATEARPLAAGIANMSWPDEPHLVIWHAQKMLREYRGDCHNLALAHGGLGGVDALVVHAALAEFPADALRKSRRWPVEPWDEAVSRLRDEGWLTDDAAPTLTETGRARRVAIEAATDALVAPAYRTIGRDGMAKIVELGEPVGAATFPIGVAKIRPSDSNFED
jgi:hypothetical protein